MPRSTPVDDFTLAYERSGSGPAAARGVHGLDRLVSRGFRDGGDEPRRERAGTGGPHRPAGARALARARSAFPPKWSDRLDAFFADVTLTRLPGAGHFSPLEVPQAFAAAIRAATA